MIPEIILDIITLTRNLPKKNIKLARLQKKKYSIHQKVAGALLTFI